MDGAQGEALSAGTPRRRRKLPWVLGTLGATLALLGVLAYVWLRAGLPQRSGEARLAGLAAPVRVGFDHVGVPHVTAGCLRDLCAAMGWLHANDRMTQLELGRRAASGRLAEIAGPDALPMDQAALQLGLRRAAERMWRASGEESRAALGAYAKGVNAWLASRGDDLPPGLRLLGIRPEPWTEVDSLCFVAMMARDLSYVRIDDELHYAWLAAGAGDRLRELLGGELVVPEATERAAAGHAAGPVEPPPRERDGSNNWVLSGARTASGHPIVAGDPHLGISLPSIWYQATLISPEYQAAGFLLPGLPMVVIGQGSEVAWSFTNTELDVNDQFLEELSIDQSSVRRPDGWREVEREVVQVAVRGLDVTVPVELRLSDIGPILPPIPARKLPARSLAWTLHVDFDPLATFLELPRARTLDEVRAALEGFVCPVQNIAVATRGGETLLTVMGRVPERGEGDGRLPVPAWEERFAWRGLRPAADNPSLANPPGGVLASANDDWLPDGYVLPFFASFATSHRVRRIREASLARGDWSAADAAGLQSDVVSLFALEVISHLPRERAFRSLHARAALDVLAGWDGAMSLEGPSALYALLERELHRAVFADELVELGLPALPGHQPSAHLLRALKGELDPRWLDDVSTVPVEGLEEVVEGALERAWLEGKRRFGPEVARWSYGSLHQWDPAHPLSGLPWVGRLFARGPYPVPGSSTTIAAFTGRWERGSIDVRHGPSMRWVSDLEDPERSRAGLPGGQSDHPLDRHFSDRIEPFLVGRSDPVPWSARESSTRWASWLTLTP